ncbi:MAG: cyclic nucleotide-binding domain-containing protein [Archangium sp.]|nr:cyclic nucleotide-binding domain-containing protein [Archangium sp.]
MLETDLALWKPPETLSVADDELATLRAVPLFKDLRDADLKRIMKLLHVREYTAGEVVFREGQTGAGMYIIQRGEVDIVARLADGSEMSLVTLHDRQFFGELALLESGARSATCVVRKPSTLLGIFQSDLEQLIERNSRLGARVIWNLARLTGARLRELSDSVRASRLAKAASSEETR